MINLSAHTRPVRALATVVLLITAACAQPPATSGEGAAAPPSTPSAATEATAAPAGNLTADCVDGHAEGVDYFPDQVTFDHAAGVTVTYADDHKVVEVVLPGGADVEPLRYVLVQCGAPAPELEGELADAQVIEVPTAEVISLTTTNLPHFDLLDAADRVVGVGVGAFVTTPSVRARVEAGDVADFADANGGPQVEPIVGAQPDLLIMDGFGDTVLEDADRLSAADVPTVLNADFAEQSLLGRAEWLKFTSLFLNAEAAANSAFSDISARYEEVATRARSATPRPTVFANTPFEGIWFSPAGDSYFANAVAEAGGTYAFADEAGTGSLELDIEAVIDAAADADVWLQAGSVNGTLDDLLASDDRFDAFKAFRDGEVWAYDAQVTPGGGNAVFETAYTRADLYLADLVEILHPDLLDHELEYFGRVPERSP